MTGVVIQPNDFDRLIKELKSCVTEEIKTIKQTVVEKPLCIQEAADYLKITRETFQRRMRKGKYKDITHRDDGSVYFLPSELHQYVKKL